MAAQREWFEKDFYAILGVPRDADEATVKKAYRKLARKHHPDQNPGDKAAEQRFKDIGEANSVLSDPEKRREYDAVRQMARGGARFTAGGPGGGNGGFEDVFSSMFGGGAGGTRVRYSTGGAGAQPNLEDLLGGMFGGRGRGRAGPVAGADQEAELPLTVEEAYRGGRRQITLNGPDGPRTYTVTIPPGVTDGRRIRLAGEGGRGMGDGPPGDLYLVVRLQPHPTFRVEGKDIYVDLRLAPWEAALGATVDVETLRGRAKLKVPPGSSSGRRLRLRGEGLRGDLYAVLKIVVPKKLSKKERELFEQLAETSKFDPRGSR